MARAQKIRFRGLIASASLKPLLLPRDALGDVRFRGLIASASLKQPFLGDGLAECVDARFRGLIASASLKHQRLRAGRGRHTSRFRGLIASASLKPKGRPNPPRPQGQIPRLDCLGLIEATGPRLGWVVVGGEIPRLDCLGLIEAWNG